MTAVVRLEPTAAVLQGLRLGIERGGSGQDGLVVDARDGGDVIKSRGTDHYGSHALL